MPRAREPSLFIFMKISVGEARKIYTHKKFPPRKLRIALSYPNPDFIHSHSGEMYVFYVQVNDSTVLSANIIQN